MKRGFLNSSKPKVHPQGPSTTPAATPSPGIDLGEIPRAGLGRLAIGKQNVELPEGFDEDVALLEREIQAQGMIVHTTVPFDKALPGEHTTECIFHPGSKEVLMGLSGFPQPMVKRVGKKSPVVVKEASGMGLGVFATRGIKAGELIFSERPLLVGGQALPTALRASWTREQKSQSSLNQLEKMLAVAVDRMSDEDKAAYMALKNSHLEDGSGPLAGIYRTNGLGIEGLRPELKKGDATAFCSGVGNLVSRLNHSCSRNVTAHWNMLTFSFQVFAVRDIAADEELTYQYCPIEGSTAERNEQLKPYDFICACPSCKDPESDARRANLKKSYPPSMIIPAWLSGNAPQADSKLLPECRRQMDILEREGMQGTSRYFQVSVAGFVACVALGDAQSASEWARKLARIRWVDKVPKDIESFVDPKSRAYKAHPVWRKKIDGGVGFDVMVKLAEMGIGSVVNLPH
ncbi:hypothetical protein FB45DRAFT_899372 [Roridomyces roridus]|uniref:SET domain-containing protein n=1 Tax=Roridomyces roridus TaxID=1738132 RepID=A0AAD7C8W8_9AGAR|nr:hypothetical protein FB45DRAFT_899372 [Roridomyces roridus]